MEILKTSIFYNNKAWYGLCIIFSAIVFIVYLNGYKIGFYYDDYDYFRNYSNTELFKSLIGDWNIGQRLGNAGYRPLANIIFHILWNLLGSNIIYYRILSLIFLVASGFIAYKIFSLYNRDRILIILGSILFVIFSDQFTHRIWLTEIPSFLSTILTLLGIYIVIKKCNFRNALISYSLIIIASLIKEVNLSFLIVPVIVQLFNNDKFKINYSIILQSLTIGIFVTAFIYIRSRAFNNLPEYINIHSSKNLTDIINLIKSFIIEFAPSLGLASYAFLVVICISLLGILIYIIKDIKLRKFSTNFYLISILIILSMASFPFISRGTLRVFFVCFSLLGLLVFLSNINKNRQFVSYILISTLIILNCLNSYKKSESMILSKNWIAQSVYFSPYYRNFMYRGKADELLTYLKKNDLDAELVSGYNNLINSLKKKTTVKKIGEFIDDSNIEFVSLLIGENKELHIMKYEFRGENLNKRPFVAAGSFVPWKTRLDHPIAGVRYDEIEKLIKHLNQKSEKYIYRSPSVQDYVLLTGNYNSIYEKNINEFAAKNVQSVFNTIPNEFDIYGLSGNVSEWTKDEINSNYGVLFGGDAHFGSHNIVFSDHRKRAKAGSMRLYGFRLAVDKINN